MPKPEKTTFAPAFVAIAAKLTEAGLPLPVPLRRAVDRDPVPLALDTRETWPVWAEPHGHSPDRLKDSSKQLAALSGGGAHLCFAGRPRRRPRHSG